MSTPSPTTLDAIVHALDEQRRRQEEEPATDAVENTILPHVRNVEHWRLVTPTQIVCTPIHVPVPFDVATTISERVQDVLHSTHFDVETRKSGHHLEFAIHLKGSTEYVPKNVADPGKWDLDTPSTIRAQHLFNVVWMREQWALEQLMRAETERLVAFISDLKHWDATKRVMTKLYQYHPACQNWATRLAIETDVRRRFESDMYYLRFRYEGHLHMKIAIEKDANGQ